MILIPHFFPGGRSGRQPRRKRSDRPTEKRKNSPTPKRPAAVVSGILAGAVVFALSSSIALADASVKDPSPGRGSPRSVPSLASLAPSGGGNPVPGGREPQERTIDLSDVESAPEYRTDEPALPGFLGNEAVALERALAGFFRPSESTPRPDGRLGLMAQWARRNLGPGNSLPPQSAIDVLAHRLGLAEPIPHLVVIEASGTLRLADVLSARLGEILDPADYTHIGGFAERDLGHAVAVIALSRRRLRLVPLPRSLAKPGRIRIEGRLIGAFTRSELAHTRPGGRTGLSGLGSGSDFGATVDLTETGRHRLEIIAHGPGGSAVVANFPVFVGVPVDGSVRAAARRGAVLPPDRVRDRILELISAARADAGLDPVAFDPELAAVALRHSEDMSANGFVSHLSPTTGATDDRLLRAGILTHLAIENVGRGYDPDEIHRGFMDSPGHRAAVLLEGATHVGIGVALVREQGQTGYLVTELFIRRIPPLGPDAKDRFLDELNRLRASAGAHKLAEDPPLSTMAGETAREFLAEPALTRSRIQVRLEDRLRRSRIRGRSRLYIASYYSTIAVVDSIEEGARQAASDPRASRAERVGLGLAQGAGPGLEPNSIILVLIFVR
jgi:uncharacterized protein YkwD